MENKEKLMIWENLLKLMKLNSLYLVMYWLMIGLPEMYKHGNIFLWDLLMLKILQHQFQPGL